MPRRGVTGVYEYNIASWILEYYEETNVIHKVINQSAFTKYQRRRPDIGHSCSVICVTTDSWSGRLCAGGRYEDIRGFMVHVLSAV